MTQETCDIVEQLQDACDLATDKRELERLCGNAMIEIKKLREMYSHQCGVTDMWINMYHSEVERKANKTLTARIRHLENSLNNVVNMAKTIEGMIVNIR